LNSIPSSVKSIIDSNLSNERKIKDLTSLGVPAIPYILDFVEMGNKEIAPVLDVLLKDLSEITFESEKINDVTKWAKENKSKFSNLRELVEKEVQ
jgi:hypothetical protein